MNKKFLLSIVILAIHSMSFSQNNVAVFPGVGYFLYHSENDLDVTEDDNFDFLLNAGMGVVFSINPKYNLLIEAEYIYSIPAKVLETYITDESGTEKRRTSFSLSQNSTILDISIFSRMTTQFDFGIGPSLAFLSRILKEKLSLNENHINDKLYSFGVGAVIYLLHNSPIGKESNFFLQTKIKTRYLYSIWFDERDRNLANYNLHYLNISGYIGIGYQF